MKFVANLKCNHTRESFENYASYVDEEINANEDVVLLPPASAFIKGEYKFSLGTQNFYPCENGAFTGEIGKEMLDEFEIRTVLIGHSERRELLGESEELLRAKFDFAVKHNLNIIYCVGENLKIHEANNTNKYLADQLSNIDLGYEHLIIAYEPIWAIGTGKSANSKEIYEALEFIASKTKAPLLYGGSVNEENITRIDGIEHCSGVLVGTASLEAENFVKLIKKVRVQDDNEW
ncbi:MAG: triose-phosphate isomerase [Campylobacter sp.]|nr:triose-phosphate isomerase [Campylobacter sp.]